MAAQSRALVNTSAHGERFAISETAYNCAMPTATSPTAMARRPRFERASEPPAFQITDRDADLILAVGRSRFLTSRHLQALVAGSADKILRRLSALFHAGYLDRPRAQLDYYSNTGSAPMVYALSDRGAQLLNARFGATFPDTDWQHKNRSVGRPFIEHTLAIADTHCALTVATQARPEVQLIGADTLIASFPTPPLSADRAFIWRSQVRRNDVIESISVNPDYVFALRSPVISRRCYLVECDRGSMPVARATFKRTSIVRKYAGYIEGYNAKLHEQQFGWKAFRILFITNTPERADHMRVALQDFTRATNIRQLFYFAHADALATNDILSLDWIDGNGQPQKLI